MQHASKNNIVKFWRQYDLFLTLTPTNVTITRMKKISFTFVASVLLILFASTQYCDAETVVVKWNGDVNTTSSHVVQTKAVDVGYDETCSTISLSFKESSEQYKILVCDEQGNIIVSDTDRGYAGSRINYTMTDAKQGSYIICVQMEDGTRIISTFNVEKSHQCIY